MAHVVCLKWHGVSYTRLNTSEKLLVLYFFNVAEQEPVEPKLFFESGAEKILNNIFLVGIFGVWHLLAERRTKTPCQVLIFIAVVIIIVIVIIVIL